MPGGRAALFTVLTGSRELTDGTIGSTRPVAAERAEVALVDLRTGDHRVLVPRGSNPHYAASGHVVYGLDGTLWAVGFDIETLQVTGTPTPVLDDVNTKTSGAANFDLADDGTIVYVPGYVQDYREEGRRLVWVDRDGNAQATVLETRAYQEFSLSPEGTHVAVRVEGDVWVYALETGTPTRITVDALNPEYAVWTPDSQRLVIGHQNGATLPLSWKPADGSGSADPLFDSDGIGRLPLAVSPDAKLVFELRGTGELGATALDGERSPFILWESPEVERTADLSPDGRRIAYESNRSGAFEVLVRPFPNVADDEHQISTAGGQWPLWNPSPQGNRQELFYVGPDGMMAVAIRRHHRCHW